MIVAQTDAATMIQRVCGDYPPGSFVVEAGSSGHTGSLSTVILADLKVLRGWASFVSLAEDKKQITNTGGALANEGYQHNGACELRYSRDMVKDLQGMGIIDCLYVGAGCPQDRHLAVIEAALHANPSTIIVENPHEHVKPALRDQGWLDDSFPEDPLLVLLRSGGDSPKSKEPDCPLDETGHPLDEVDSSDGGGGAGD